jgi:hypothetical protein
MRLKKRYNIFEIKHRSKVDLILNIKVEVSYFKYKKKGRKDLEYKYKSKKDLKTGVKVERI